MWCWLHNVCPWLRATVSFVDCAMCRGTASEPIQAIIVTFLIVRVGFQFFLPRLTGWFVAFHISHFAWQAQNTKLKCYETYSRVLHMDSSCYHWRTRYDLKHLVQQNNQTQALANLYSQTKNSWRGSARSLSVVMTPHPVVIAYGAAGSNLWTKGYKMSPTKHRYITTRLIKDCV